MRLSQSSCGGVEFVNQNQWLLRITGRKNETSYKQNWSQLDPYSQLAFETNWSSDQNQEVAHCRKNISY